MSAPVLGVVAVLSDGRKHLLALELCGGASGQIKLRKIDGWRKIATVLSQQASVAA